MNPLYLVAALAAYYYVPTVIGLLKLDVSVKSFIPVKISERSIEAQINIAYKNNSLFALRLQRLSADVYFGSVKIGTLTQQLRQTIPARAERVIPANITIDYNSLGAELWQTVLDKNLNNTDFSIKGNITANNKNFAFSKTWKVTDFVNGLIKSN